MHQATGPADGAAPVVGSVRLPGLRGTGWRRALPGRIAAACSTGRSTELFGARARRPRLKPRAKLGNRRRSRSFIAAQSAPVARGVTLHSLRRTYASMLFAIDSSAPQVMEQLGHADARLTLRIYARAMSGDVHEHERLRALVQGEPLGTIGHWPARSPKADSDRAPADLARRGELQGNLRWSQPGSNR